MINFDNEFLNKMWTNVRKLNESSVIKSDFM